MRHRLMATLAHFYQTCLIATRKPDKQAPLGI